MGVCLSNEKRTHLHNFRQNRSWTLVFGRNICHGPGMFTRLLKIYILGPLRDRPQGPSNVNTPPPLFLRSYEGRKPWLKKLEGPGPSKGPLALHSPFKLKIFTKLHVIINVEFGQAAVLIVYLVHRRPLEQGTMINRTLKGPSPKGRLNKHTRALHSRRYECRTTWFNKPEGQGSQKGPSQSLKTEKSDKVEN